MAKETAQVEPDKDDKQVTPPKDPLEPNPFDRRAGVMAEIDRTRREMLAEGGIELEPEPDPEPDPDSDPKPNADASEEPATDAATDSGEPDGPPADDVGDDGADPQQDDPDADAGAEPGGEPEPAAAEPAEGAEADKAQQPGEPLVKVVVDGEEQEIPLSDVVAGYQVRATADKRLKIANETLEQAEQLRTRLIQGGEGPRPSGEEGAGGEKPKDQPSADANPLDGIDWAKLGNDLQYASPEEAGNALKATVEQIITQGASDPAATRDELESQILNRLEWDQSVQRFQSDYEDIVKDPVLSQAAATFANAFWGQAVEQAEKTGGPRPQYWAVWDAAGKATRQWLEDKSGGKDGKDLNKNPNDDDSSDPSPAIAIEPDRAERKRVAAQPPEPRQPQTRREPDPSAPVNSEKSIMASRRSAIGDMRKARGQAGG